MIRIVAALCIAALAGCAPDLGTTTIEHDGIELDCVTSERGSRFGMSCNWIEWERQANER